MPITIELSLSDNPLAHILFSNMACAISGCTSANASVIWQIQKVQAKCDLIAVDSSLNESHIRFLEERKLTLIFNTFISQYQSIIYQTDISINITRSYTRF